MSDSEHSNDSRRTFLGQGLLAGGTLLTGTAAAAPVDPETKPGELPRRILGRTGVPVTMLTLGTAPCGKQTPSEIADLVNAALDEGINFVDTSQNYGNSQEGVGLGLGSRRKDVFLATKVFANNLEDAKKSLATSLRLLKTDHFDLLYYHGLGCLDIEGASDPNGVFTWLLKQKQAGTCRFLGVSIHKLPARCPQFLETGEVDVVMPAMNFIDRHTYGFEDKVLPVARKHNLGIVAMKVFGGIRSKKVAGDKYSRARAMLDAEHQELAIRYALGTPGVATVNIGSHDAKQLRQNVQRVKNYRPLSSEEDARLAKVGRELAPVWGEHLGAVTEENPPRVRTS